MSHKINDLRVPTPAELGYIAGLIDGEGWIGLARRKRHWKCYGVREYYLRPALVIGMARREPLDYVAAALGLRVEELPKREGDLYRLRLHANALRHLLPLLIPYLKLKKRQAEILVEFLTGCKYHGKELTPEQWMRRELLGEEMRRLNERPASIRRRLECQRHTTDVCSMSKVK